MVKLIECPRDAWQGLPGQMPSEVKADYLRVLIAAGFHHIDAVSFVSKTAVPQMADSELVLQYLDPPDDVEIIGIVVNEKGLERALATPVPTSVVCSFLGAPRKPLPALPLVTARGDLELLRAEDTHVLSVSRWVGAKVGVFASAAPGAPKTGHADFDWFRVTP